MDSEEQNEWIVVEKGGNNIKTEVVLDMKRKTIQLLRELVNHLLWSELI